ncbi:MAG: hypothetical protein HUK21_00310 [Fibrobacteraceae bacterium]|nr:hypothetical protein [Fibrobacteraceae bacterium]
MNKTILFFIASLATLCSLTACKDVRTETYPNGQVLSEVEYVNDKKQGLEKEFFENGNVKKETNYVEGRKEGPAKEYYEDGTLQAEMTYENGYMNGLVTKYYKNGKMQSKASYREGKQVDFGEYFEENGEPSTSGSFKDPRDGMSYEWVKIGEQTWIAQNMVFATANGSLCLQCNNWGRLYNFESAKKACMDGFHIPSKEEFQQLLKFVGEKPGVKLKAGFGWDPLKGTNNYGNGKDEFGFGAKAGGAHLAQSDVPLKERKYEGAGQKALFWTTEGEVFVLYYDKDIAKFEKLNPEFGASIRCLKD